MYSSYSICDRLKITPPRLKTLIELIEDANYPCTPTYAGNIAYYSTEVVGWVVQLKQQYDLGLAQDFKAIAVDETEITLMMEEPVGTDVVEGVETSSTNVLSPQVNALSPEAIASAIASQLAVSYYSPYAQKVEEMRYKQKLQGLLKKAIAQGDMLSREDINNYVDRYPPKSIKVYCHWDCGIYRFTNLGKGLWTADYKEFR